MPARGSSQFGPDVVVNSPEYWKLWREKNKERNKISQDRYRVKQKQLALAAKLSMEDGIPIEKALAEVRGEIDAQMIATKRVEEQLVADGRIQPSHLSGTSIQHGEVKEIEFVRENADEWGVSYAFALETMDGDLDTWDEKFKAERDRILAELAKPD